MGLPLIAVIAIAAIVFAGGGADPSSPDERRQGAENGGAGSGGSENAGLGTPSLGSEDAPVVLTEYSDYQ